jgi:hypothetical protein
VREVPRLKPADFKALDPGEGFISTLLQTRDGTENALYKVRFPLVSMAGWQHVTLPGQTHTPVDYADDGLNLWARYMTPETLQQHTQHHSDEAA